MQLSVGVALHWSTFHCYKKYLFSGRPGRGASHTFPVANSFRSQANRVVFDGGSRLNLSRNFALSCVP